MTFTTFSKKWLQARPAADASRLTYGRLLAKHILPIFGEQDCQTFDLGLVSPWLRGLCAKDRHTVSRMGANIMRSLLDDLVTKRYIKTNPLRAKPLEQILRDHGFSGPSRGSLGAAYIKAPILIPNGGEIPFGEYATAWAEGDSNDRVVRDFRARIIREIWIPAFGDKTLKSVDRLDILRATIPLQHAGRLGDGLVALKVLSSCFRSANMAGRIFANPARSKVMCFNVPPAPGKPPKHLNTSAKRLYLAVRQERRASKQVA